MLCYVAKHSKQCKTTKPIKCNELHRLDVRTIKTMLNYKSDLNYKSHPNYKSNLNYKSDQNPMTCIDLTSKRSKMLSYVAKHSKQRKTTKPIKCNELHRLDVRTIKTKLNYKSGLNYKSDQNPMTCIDLTSKRSKMLSYVAKHSKQCKTTKPIKCNELHRLDVKTIKTKLNYKSDQNPMTCIDLTSKRSKMLSYVAKHSKQRKTTKSIKIQWLASIWFKTIKNFELRRKTFKTTQNYKIDQIAMNCIAWMSERSKQC